MKKILNLILISLASAILHAQSCESYYPTKVGTIWAISSYNAKDKLTGTSKVVVLSNNPTANGYSLELQSTYYDAKNKEIVSRKLTMRCENGVFYIDMKNYLNPESFKNTKENAELKIDGTDLEMPGNLSVGQTLKDGTITLSYGEAGTPMAMMNMTVRIFDRKVEAIENITTPAGTFECYKISYTLEVQSIFKMTVKAIDWFAKNVGSVRNESYDDKGKLLSYSVLTEFK